MRKFNKNKCLAAVSLISFLTLVGCQEEKEKPFKPFVPDEQVLVVPDNTGYWFVKDGSRAVGSGELYYIDSNRWVTFPHSSQYPTRSRKVVDFVSGDRPYIYLSTTQDGKVYFERMDWFFQKDNRNIMYLCSSEVRNSREAFSNYQEPNREDLPRGCRDGKPWIVLYRDLAISGDWAEESQGGESQDAFSITYDYFAGDKIIERSNDKQELIVERKAGGVKKYSRFVWRREGAKLLGCFDIKDKMSFNEVVDAPKKDIDFENIDTGCQGGKISVFRRTLPFVTAGNDDWNFDNLDVDSKVTISASEFGGNHIEFVDNRLGYFVTSKKGAFQSDRKYSLYNYMTRGWGDSYYCLVASDLNSSEVAIQTDTSNIDRRDISKGCKGNRWVHLSRKQVISDIKGYWSYDKYSATAVLAPGVSAYIGDDWFGQEILKYDSNNKIFVTAYRRNGRLLYSGYKYEKETTVEYPGKKLLVTPIVYDSPNLRNVLDALGGSLTGQEKKDTLLPSTPFDGVYFDLKFPVFHASESMEQRDVVINHNKLELSIGLSTYIFKGKISDEMYIFEMQGKFYVVRFTNVVDKSGKLYYCFVPPKTVVKPYQEPEQGFLALDLATAAASSATFQDSNANSGCNGRPWRPLDSLPIVGNWFNESEDSASSVNITPQVWGEDTIVFLVLSQDANTPHKVILQNYGDHSNGEYKVIFFSGVIEKNGLNRFYFCEDKATYIEKSLAKQASMTFDVSDPRACNNIRPWTMLTANAW